MERYRMKYFIPSTSLGTTIALAFALGACATQLPSPLPPDVAGQSTQGAQTVQVAPPVVGDDRDAHGCIGSASYSWYETTRQCERPWELAKQKAFMNSAEAYDQFCGSESGK